VCAHRRAEQSCDSRPHRSRERGQVFAGKALAADLPEIPLYQQLSVNAYSNKLGGYKANADFWFNNSNDWYLNS